MLITSLCLILESLIRELTTFSNHLLNVFLEYQSYISGSTLKSLSVHGIVFSNPLFFEYITTKYIYPNFYVIKYRAKKESYCVTEHSHEVSTSFFPFQRDPNMTKSIHSSLFSIIPAFCLKITNKKWKIWRGNTKTHRLRNYLIKSHSFYSCLLTPQPMPSVKLGKYWKTGRYFFIFLNHPF